MFAASRQLVLKSLARVQFSNEMSTRCPIGHESESTGSPELKLCAATSITACARTRPVDLLGSDPSDLSEASGYLLCRWATGNPVGTGDLRRDNSIHGSGWIEAKISARFQLSKETAACPRCEGRYRLVGFSVGCYGRTGQLREALAHSASRNRADIDSCHPRTRHRPRSSCGCGHGDVVGGIDVADRFHRPLHHHQLEHGAANRLEA